MAEVPESIVSDVRASLGRNLTYGIQEVLGRSIVIGDYKNKPFPTEAELVRTHGVSRVVMREAVKMLGAKGLLAARPKQGTFVRPLDAWNLSDPDVLRWLLERGPSIELLRHFNELRMGVEPQAAAIAARRASATQLEAIRSGLERMRQAEKDRDDPLEADLAFHVAILRATNNPFYVQFREVVATALRASIRVTNRIAGRTANIDDHAAVCDAILAGDAEHAANTMRRLIKDVLDLIEPGASGGTNR